MDNKHRELRNADFARRFDTVAASFDRIVSKYSAFRRYHAMIPFIRGRTLDAGSGTGWLSRLSNPKEAVIHLDISINMCRVVQKRTGFPVLCGDAEFLPTADSTIDTIVSSEMIYYLANPNRFFKEAHRTLKPGGRLLITSANQEAAFYDRCRAFLRRIGFSRTYFDDGNRHFVTEKEMKRFFDGNGFQVVMCRKIMTLPLRSFHWLDQRLEATSFSRFALYIVMAGTKTDDRTGRMATIVNRKRIGGNS